MKKIISVLLTIFMIAGVMNFSVYADDGSVTVDFATANGTFDPNKGSGDYFYDSGACSWNINIPENGYYQLTVKDNYVKATTFEFLCGNEKISEQFTDAETTVVMNDHIYLEKGVKSVKFTTSQGGTIKNFTLTLMEKTTLVKFKATDGTLSNVAVNGWFSYGGSVTYTKTIPANGYYEFSVNHKLEQNPSATEAKFILSCGKESITEGFADFDNTEKTTTMKDAIYLEKGAQSLKFTVLDGGGYAYEITLKLIKEETHVDFDAKNDTCVDGKNGYNMPTSTAWSYKDGTGINYSLDIIPANGIYKLSVWYQIDSENNTFTAKSDTETVTQAAPASTTQTKVDFENGIYLEKGGSLNFIPTKGGAIYKFRLTLVSEETRLSKKVTEWSEYKYAYDNGYFTDLGYAVYDFNLPANGKYDVLITYSGTPNNTETSVTYLNKRYAIAKVAHSGVSAETIVSGLEMYKKDGKIKIAGLGNCTVTGVSLIMRETLDSISLTKLGYATVSAGYNAAGAAKAIDGDEETSWFFNVAGTPDKDISNKWIQVNLDAPHKITKIRYLSGKNAAWDMFGKEISIRVSNDPEFRTYKEIASTAKNGAIPTDGSTYYDISVNEQEEYRYVRVAKNVENSANLAMACAELEVLGAEETTVNSAINFAKDAEVITKITSGTCTAGTVVTNKKESDADYSIIVGLYNNAGVMTECLKKTVTVEQGRTAPISIDFETSEDTVRVQCAVFDGYETALMACDSNSLTAE